MHIYIYIGSRPKVPRRQSRDLPSSKVLSSFFTAFYDKFSHMSMLCSMTFHIFLRGRNWMSSAQDVLQNLYFKTFKLCV